MRPKGKLFALFAIFAAIGLVTASGAFTTVQADRTVAIDVAGDSSALLQLESSSNDNGNYVNTGGNQIVVDLENPGGQGATGLNSNATTDIDQMINVTNNGENEITFYVTRNTNDANVDIAFYNGTELNPTNNITTQSNEIKIGSGQSELIGMQVETGGSTGDYNQSITFHANSTA